jgi:hypothetical protein
MYDYAQTSEGADAEPSAKHNQGRQHVPSISRGFEHLMRTILWVMVSRTFPRR